MKIKIGFRLEYSSIGYMTNTCVKDIMTAKVQSVRLLSKEINGEELPASLQMSQQYNLKKLDNLYLCLALQVVLS
jgi:hypothetical protein